ncbi:MAG TPA: mechanosensitive ion channel domain-containing protein [Terriglobales bacterium]|nr:mechanosensitive ion channel domain-containing protein [Terriglobales bacterium]
MADTSDDLLFVNDSREIANQVVRLAFDFARADEQLLDKRTGEVQAPPQGPNGSRYQALNQILAKLDEKAQQVQQEVDTLRQSLQSASPRQRPQIETTIAENQSELDMIGARRDVIRSMTEFLGGTEDRGSGDLASQIEALASSVPTALTKPTNASTGGSSSQAVPPVAAGTATRLEPSGIWGLIADVFAMSRKLHTLDEGLQLTDELAKSCKQLESPLVNNLKALTKQSDALADQSESDQQSVAQQKSTIDSLTAQFKLLSSSFVPLSKQAVLLDLYQKNLTNWRNAVKERYSSDLKSLALRFGSLVLILAIVWGAAELWRRTILRYVHETRRRYQFLLLRRIAIWVLTVLIVAFSFASQLGSVATFAGLLTAGVAVALQSVLLSVAGYFFLIGRFGVKVGDRVQISGVAGEVVEIGLVRLHVMELGGSGTDLQPTGRIVAFSNSFVFQPNAGVFKQIPGTNFVWHEITITLDRDSDYQLVEKRVFAAVDNAFRDYRSDFERQRMQIENNLASVSVVGLKPRTRFRLTPSGLDVNVRFPVEFGKGLEIDERVTRELLSAIEQEPRLKVVGSDIPTVRLADEVRQPTSKAS